MVEWLIQKQNKTKPPKNLSNGKTKQNKDAPKGALEN
jgi:hypothetical protein